MQADFEYIRRVPGGDGMRQFKLLIVYDVAVQTPDGILGWAYYRRAIALQACAPPDFNVSICALVDFVPETMAPQYDCVFILDYTAIYHLFARWPRGCKTPRVCSFNRDSRSYHKQWAFTPQYSTWTVVNNADRFYKNGPEPRTCYIPVGVSDFWRPLAPNPRPRRVLWSGSTSLKKGKRYHEILQPLEKMLNDRGEDVSFRPIDDIKTGIVFPALQQRVWYNSGDICVCASNSEGGGPNYMLEGAACGCIPVSTDVGNVREWAGNIGVVASPEAGISPVWFLNAIDLAREQCSVPRVLAEMQKWLYAGPNGLGNYFFALFRRLINDGPESLSPFDWRERHFLDI
jgi:glycosyltransferase involved in cell wall biosynthesis